MSSVATRTIGVLPNTAVDRFDAVAIKTEWDNYNPPVASPKWGIIKVTISSIVWTTTDPTATILAGTLDLRPPMFNEDNDVPILDRYPMTSNSGSVTPTITEYLFPVNNGVIGPAAFVQGDNTIDLLVLKVRMPEGTTIHGFRATVNYEISFTDLTPSAVSTANESMTLHVDNVKQQAVGCVTGTPTGTGYQVFALVNLVTTGIDVVTDLGLPLSQSSIQDYFAQQPDFVPFFAVTMSGTGRSLVQHPTTKWSGTKTYPLRSFNVFAINGGKVDGNANNTLNSVRFLDVSLAKSPGAPCNDDVTCVLNYYTAFTTV